MTTWVDVRRTISVALVCHAVIHLLGVMTSWRLSPFRDPPYDTVILAGTVDGGAVGQTVMGGLWLMAAIALIVAAITLWRGGPHAVTAVAAGIAISLAVALVALPASRFGVVIDGTALLVIGVALAAPKVDQAVRAAKATRRHATA
jgi:hypothetical protein